MIIPSIAIHLEIKNGISPIHQAKTTATKTHHLVAFYYVFQRLVSAPFFLAYLPSGFFLSSFCGPSAGYIVRLTVPPANTNLVPSRLGRLPEHMIYSSISHVFLTIFRFYYLVPFSGFEIPATPSILLLLMSGVTSGLTSPRCIDK